MSDQAPKDWALVTGASRGIGRAIAMALAADGLHVVVDYIQAEAKALEVVAEIQAASGQAETLALDVADQAACVKALRALEDRLGPPYVIVNNAGILADGLLVWMPPEDWHRVLQTNLYGFYHVTQPLLKGMISRRRGRILSITSAAGQVGNAGQVNYAASKAGLIGATLSLAKEVAKRGLTVNAIAPGFIETDMTAELPGDRLRALVPAGRFGRPEEVAALVRFLVSEEAGYVTGQVIGVNGGLA